VLLAVAAAFLLPSGIESIIIASTSLESCVRRSTLDSPYVAPEPTSFATSTTNGTTGTQTVTCARKLIVSLTVASGDVGTTAIEAGGALM